jgi:hypothetical protein
MSKPEPGEDDRRPRNGKNASPWHRDSVAQGPPSLYKVLFPEPYKVLFPEARAFICWIRCPLAHANSSTHMALELGSVR